MKIFLAISQSSYCCFSYIILLTGRSSPPEVFCKKRFLRNFAKFTGKHLCQSLFFNKVAGLRHATLVKKRLWHICFPVNFVKILRTPFYTSGDWFLTGLLSKQGIPIQISHEDTLITRLCQN